jgi:putative colanic acid biosynthesis acetyltransferase WcaB
MRKINEPSYRFKYHRLFQDWKANKGNFKSRFILISFRLAVFVRKHSLLTIVFFWYLILYRIIIECFFNIEMSWHIQIGKNLKLNHGQGLVIEASAVFGDNCTLRHFTTIGHKMLPDGTYGKSPKIGNNVDIGSGVTIIGSIEIGDNAIIGAGAVITKSVPSNAVMVGNPGRLLKMSYTKNTIVQHQRPVCECFINDV